MASMLARAAQYAGRNYFGTGLRAGAVALAASMGSTVAFADKTERSYIMLKPDAVQRGLVGAIIARFEARGYKLVAMKLVTPSLDHAKKHYHDLSERPFFPKLCKFLSSGPVVAMVWEGEDIIKQGLNSSPGTIRGDMSIMTGKNIIHGSDSVESAKDEIKLWFTEAELNGWTSTEAEAWVWE